MLAFSPGPFVFLITFLLIFVASGVRKTYSTEVQRPEEASANVPVKVASVVRNTTDSSISGDSESTRAPWPCEQNGTCVVVKSRSLLPTLPPTAEIEFTYREAALGAAPTMAKLVNQYHSGLTMIVQEKGKVVQNFTIEMWGRFSPMETLFPTGFNESGPTWHRDTAEIMLREYIDEAYWSGSSGVKIVKASGETFNKFMDWVVEFATDPVNADYQPLAWWPARKVDHHTRQFNYDYVCDTFIQNCLWKLADLGATLITDGPVLRRNYLVAINDEVPVVVDGTDKDVKPFYQLLIAARRDSWVAFLAAVTELLYSSELPFIIRDIKSGPNKYAKLPPGSELVLNYDVMALPPQWFESCNRDLNVGCGFWRPCSFWRSAECTNTSGNFVSGTCVCPQDKCAHEARLGFYCA